MADNNYLAGLYEILLRRQDPNDQTEWADVVDFMNDHGGNYNREFVRKAWPLLSMYIDAGWVNRPDTEVSDGTRTAVSLNTDGTTSSERQFEVADGTDLNDADFLLRAHGYDPSQFRLVQARSSFWDSPSGSRRMCSSRITVAPATTSAVTDDDIEEWLANLPHKCVKPAVQAARHVVGDKLLVLPVSDLHHNLLATVFSSGNEYNCKIAEEIWNRVIDDVLTEVKSDRVEKIVLTIGGDQANADGPTGATTKGTPQDCELPYYDACEHLYDMTVKGIERLSEVAPVDVIYVPGNHDKVTGFQLAKYVAAWFRDDANVSVDYSPLPRKYYVWGSTLFVFAHDGDLKKLPQLIADEARSVWSSVKYTEVMLQHLHSEQVLMEQYNMRIQRIPSAAARSQWTTNCGYGSKRQCKSFVYDKDDGLRRVIYTTI